MYFQYCPWEKVSENSVVSYFLVGAIAMFNEQVTVFIFQALWCRKVVCSLVRMVHVLVKGRESV